MRFSSEVNKPHRTNISISRTHFCTGIGCRCWGSKCCRCCSNSGSDQVSIGTYDRKTYLPSKAYMLHPRVSSIMSILVHALNLRLSADEKVDFAPSGKCQLSETSRRRWLECNLTRDYFRTPWCSLIVVLPRTFGRHQLRLSAFFNSHYQIFQLLSDAQLKKNSQITI